MSTNSGTNWNVYTRKSQWQLPVEIPPLLSESEKEEEEAEESEAMELVEEFDESVDRFELSGWRPMRLCTAYRGGGCVRGWGCTFAHGEQELHPRALASRPW